MPFVLIEANESYKVGVWSISEPEDFFRNTMQYQPDANHPAKRLQQWASRAILTHLNSDFPLDLIKQHEHSKPVLSNGMMQFNISHTSEMAAAIISEHISVGIDIEKIALRVHKIWNRFLSYEELELLHRFPEHRQTTLLTLCWSIKESVFKWWGKGNIDFANDIKINDVSDEIKMFVSVDFLADQTYKLKVHCIQLEDHWLTFIVQ